jgi:hypothetical protein
MQEHPDSNWEFEPVDIFSSLNQYFLLIFSMTCILSSVFLQELFVSFDQFRLGIAVAPVFGIILPVFLLTKRFRAGFMT